jgi:hypothetical protein
MEVAPPFWLRARLRWGGNPQATSVQRRDMEDASPRADGNCSTLGDVSERGTTNGQTSQFGGTRTLGGTHATW